jgi:hypothetical protein
MCFTLLKIANSGSLLSNKGFKAFSDNNLKLAGCPSRFCGRTSSPYTVVSPLTLALE